MAKKRKGDKRRRDFDAINARRPTSRAMSPLTSQEKAYYDTIKQVAQSVRPNDLVLQRMWLEGKDVAVITQRVVSSETAETVGFQPLAVICDDATAAALRDVDGSGPESVSPHGLEGPA